MCGNSVLLSPHQWISSGGVQTKKRHPEGRSSIPVPFFVVAEGFSSLLDREVAYKNLQGFKINNYCPTLSHLFFTDNSLIFCRASREECQVIKEIFKRYEQASGQMINLNKSMFMTNKNVGATKAKELGDILGIKQTNSLGSYLGMPSKGCKNKRIMFKRIKESVRKALQDWKERLFLARGKKVLIKVVVQAIPTYTMSCFKLPKGLCEKINSKCARFWWGAMGYKKKLHWASWGKLCKSRDLGGFGFRDIHLFNQAMLSRSKAGGS